jgi:transposase
MNTSYKKCDIKPWNIPDLEKQEEMIVKLDTMKQECKEEKSVILFSDAVHQLHTTHNWYAVQFKGKKNTKVLASNTGRNRFTVIWAVNPQTCQTSFVTTTGMCNQEVVKLLIDEICKDYKSDIENWKKIYLILDNARYQRAKEVTLYAEKMKVELCFLPPYCPHLNVIERLRKWLKKKLRNRYIPLFTEFCDIITDIMKSTQNNVSELSSLLAMNFGII